MRHGYGCSVEISALLQELQRLDAKQMLDRQNSVAAYQAEQRAREHP
jgi:hypothetical protein